MKNPILRSEIRRGAYYDSIVLMQLQVALAALDGVDDSGVVMATEANLAQLERGGLLPSPRPEAAAEDLLLVVRAESAEAADAALAQVDTLLARRRGASPGDAYQPKSLAAAVRQLPEARWVLVSVAGRWAADVARDALELGRHVFLYSDNVSLEQEAELKRVGRAKGLLVLGPDCGTTILGGVNLGFANRVRRGAIGLVGASGTGLQMVTSHIHRLGGGVSHALGTGGRDLQDAIGGSTALQSLDLLARDPETRVLVLVSKPPDAAVAARLLGAAQGLGKPVVAALLGYAPPARRLGNVYFSAGLDDAAELAVRLASAGSEAPITAASTSNGRLFLRGLFSGGTLAYEALLALRTRLAEVRSNVSLPGIASLDDPTTSLGNTVVDLGDDALTVGRLHPMMDPDACRRRLRQEAADPEVASILLDIVLGDGAHPDPAGELAPVLAEIRDADGPPVTVLVVGTDDDPQGLDGQIERLEAAGAAVFRTTAEAVEHAVAAIPTPARTADSASHPPVSLDALASPLAAINVGVEAFHQTLLAGGAEAVQVAWRPPAGGNEKLRALLEKMKR